MKITKTPDNTTILVTKADLAQIVKKATKMRLPKTYGTDTVDITQTARLILAFIEHFKEQQLDLGIEVEK